MNWQEIKISSDLKSFEWNGQKVFVQEFLEVLKFHSPGLAPVHDSSGWYHINKHGNALYKERYRRAFGYYNNRATVIDDEGSFHIDENGKELYPNRYQWCGNFQEELCVVRENSGFYGYIDLHGKKAMDTAFLYAGDYKDGYACIKTANGWTHINKTGTTLHNQYFLDLGVYHKSFATARDQKGWFHIDLEGKEIYDHRFIQIEPFYNGIALVHDFNWNPLLLKETGDLSSIII
jgi:hypothetical protein